MRAQGIIQGNVGRLLKRFISKPSYFGRKCSLFGGERRIPFLASLSSCYFQETIIFKRSFPEFPRKYVYQKSADIKKETGTRKPHTTVVLTVAISAIITVSTLLTEDEFHNFYRPQSTTSQS